MLTCRNGHKQPANADRFCIFCGMELTDSERKPRSNASTPLVTQLPPPLPPSCQTCGGNGSDLNEKTAICKQCNWLRPLRPGYEIDYSAFAWAADAKAMAALRSLTPLNMAAQVVSEKVGRPWIETTFNGVLLSEKQLPQIYEQAVRAAQLLGMSHMPDVYLSGDRSWDCLTFGTDKDSFVVVGSALASSFRGPDMLFLLAREMGHCRAGHALWKSVIRFLLGEHGPSKGIMSGGILNAIISPTALISGALEVPLLAWARQAEITADRAGLLAVGDEKIARRVLLTWALKSPVMYRQINIDAWLEQEGAEHDTYSKLSEMTTTSTPYMTPRLRQLAEFSKSEELQSWRRFITASLSRKKSQLPPRPPVADVVKVKCVKCSTLMVIPQSVLAGKTELSVKCPNEKCNKINKVTKKSSQPQVQKVEAEVMNIKCASCKTAMVVPRKVLEGKDQLLVKCPNPKCGKITRLNKAAKQPVQQPAKQVKSSAKKARTSVAK